MVYQTTINIIHSQSKINLPQHHNIFIMDLKVLEDLFLILVLIQIPLVQYVNFFHSI